MADETQPPPPKPKPGSLRDRIAAFEKPSAATPATPNRPPVRPKPGNVSWKPAPPSPTSAAPSVTTPENEESKRGGMSASDAKESIGRGGSLKERMAALQGKGAFGGGSPPGPPPVGPKPVKRPPLVVPAPPVDEDDENEKSRGEPKSDEHEDAQKPGKEVEDAAEESAAPETEGNAEPTEEEQDEEAKERERRAAIAARMARLGGARVGMGPPPVFGKKPVVKEKPKEVREQPEEPKEEPKETSIPAPVESSASELSTTRAEEPLSSPEAKEDSGAEIPRIVTDEEVSSKNSLAQASQSSLSTTTSPSESRPVLDSSSSQSSVTTSRSPPTSMPLPAAPRRAGPPRSRSARNIKAEASKQDKAADEALPVPSETHVEPVAAPTLPVEKEAGTEEAIQAKEDSTLDEPAEPVIPEDNGTLDAVEKDAATTDPEIPVTLLSPDHAHDEELVREAPKSPEDAHTEDEGRQPDVPAVSQADVDPSPEPKVDDEMHTASQDTLDHSVPVASQQEMRTDPKAPQSSEPPVPVVTSTSEDSVHEEAPALGHEEKLGAAAADEASTPSTMIEQSPSPSDPKPGTLEPSDSQVDATIERESEQPKIATAENETEDEETARRKRIAERMAKMGGRNPFAASPFAAGAPPSRKASGNDPQESASVPTHKEPSAVEQDTGDDDIPHEQETIAKPSMASDSHEAQDLGPRVSGMEEEYEQAEDVPVVQAPAEEHEETRPDHKTTPELLTTASLEEHPEPVSLTEEPTLIEDADEMAPPRITRAIPPLPPQPQQEDRAVSPIATNIKRASTRRSLPPPPEEPSPVVPHDAHDAREEVISKEVQAASDHVEMSPIAPISTPSPPMNQDQGDVEKDSPLASPIHERPIPPRAPVVPPLAETTISQSPPSASSEYSRRSIPPPLPRTISPTSRRATSPPARKPPGSPPRSASPQTDTVVSPTSSVRRSIPPPRRTPSIPSEEPAVLPTRRVTQLTDAAAPPSRRSSSSSVSGIGGAVSQPPTVPLTESATHDTHDEVSPANRYSIEEQEVLEDSEPDPIDPSFYSPPRSPIVTPSQSSFASRSKEVTSAEAIEEDNEQARRRTIAERMAKLGGIKFGAPPPMPRKPSVAPPEASAGEDISREGLPEGVEATENAREESQEVESAEAERARRQAISARLAGMGGMRFGMLPQTSLPVHPRARSDESASTLEAHSPPELSQHPPPPESATSDADMESEEGVKVEAGSEMSMEEVTAEDVTEDPEEIPPPVPSRPERQSSRAEVAPPLPGGRRPPVPTSPLPRPTIPSTESKHSRGSGSIRTASGGSSVPAPYSNDFVVVDDPAGEEETPPPPPPRAARPPRSIPPPAPPVSAVPSASTTREMANSQWELPDIRTGSLDLTVGRGLGLDESFTSEDSTTYPPALSSQPPPRAARHVEPTPPASTSAAPQSDVQLSADELLQLWGIVGTAVHSAASSLFDKSKKTLIGDGTSQGFVKAVLAQVPQASAASYGHLVYSQNAHAVLRRSSNIMPGDIIQLTEAKLKGHKGLQSYNQTVGTSQEPLVAIVSEFDTKKSKVKVYQANQHVGAQTVETASYRLEDLKSGNVKVFRVASA